MSVLSTAVLRRRIYGVDGSGGDIFVMPLLEDAHIADSAMDIRLGRHFLLTRRSRIESIDPQKLTRQDVPRYQEEVFVNFGEAIVLHPEEAVLGVVLEYIAVPEDVYAEVMTRSSWGRVDITIATAICVHPGYAGCLTLELENKGTVPVKLYPGTRLGQLTFHSVGQEKDSGRVPSQYAGTTKPQFSGLYKEKEELQRFERVGDRLKGRLAKAGDAGTQSPES